MNDATRMLREALIGKQLSAVTFVMDYFQFDFDSDRLTVHTVPTVDLCREDISNYRDQLCAFIAQIVTSVEEVPDTAIHIDFGDFGRLTIPLDEDSRRQVEAAAFRPFGKAPWIW
jgi:hypothetical protein